MSIKESHAINQSIANIKKEIGEQVTLVAVSKTKPSEDIMIAYEGGQRVFGENKVQELREKHEQLPKDIQWHLIGHLQTNKVKYIAPFVSLIHSLDSEKLAKEIQKRAVTNERVIDCLIQIHLAENELSKHGFSFQEAQYFFEKSLEHYPNIRIKGMMAMGSLTSNEEVTKQEFRKMNTFFREMRSKFPQLEILSMGMSGDYLLAIEEGSNMIRVGSTIFGARNYKI
ncbi:MAG: YggS family pyridoxal phosphate-dependent enzyme [Flavobacteriales bacterium]|jgi:pyridoxal phosphate enzyme (YggS family)|nr:YggS family pyridoxal phosphate-dependent enzyme [Flavobacteriales bacterium]